MNEFLDLSLLPLVLCCGKLLCQQLNDGEKKSTLYYPPPLCPQENLPRHITPVIPFAVMQSYGKSSRQGVESNKSSESSIKHPLSVMTFSPFNFCRKLTPHSTALALTPELISTRLPCAGSDHDQDSALLCD